MRAAVHAHAGPAHFAVDLSALDDDVSRCGGLGRRTGMSSSHQCYRVLMTADALLLVPAEPTTKRTAGESCTCTALDRNSGRQSPKQIWPICCCPTGTVAHLCDCISHCWPRE